MTTVLVPASASYLPSSFDAEPGRGPAPPVPPTRPPSFMPLSSPNAPPGAPPGLPPPPAFPTASDSIKDVVYHENRVRGEDDDVPFSVEETDRDPFPDWVRAKGLQSFDEARRVMYPPGSVRNPLTFIDQTFEDIIFKTGDVHMHFVRCRFVRSGFVGDAKCVRNDLPIHEGIPLESTARHANVMGSVNNPLIFVERTFAHLDMNFGDVFAELNECRFVKCALTGFRKTNLYAPHFISESVGYDTSKYVFFAFASNARGKVKMFGTVEAETPPPPAAPPAVAARLNEAVKRMRNVWRSAVNSSAASTTTSTTSTTTSSAKHILSVHV